MKRLILAALALTMAIGLQPNVAQAQGPAPAPTWGWGNGSFLDWWGHGQDPRLTTAGIGIGIGTGVGAYFLTQKHGNPGHARVTTLGAYGITTGACMVATPFVYTVAVNRPLTYREVYMGMADCIVPFIGSYLVNAYLPHNVLYDGVNGKMVRY
ncbi:MAG TPA: hypothetical protein VMA30_14045 [Xanthobacteraceae bacterium]|nr:hypothetical protein [Xanthobacteraceae bacterium]